MISTINPYTNTLIKDYQLHTTAEVETLISKGATAFQSWKVQSIGDRTHLLNKVSQLLIERKQEYAELMTNEMGKPISQSLAEIEKCSSVCDFYVRNAAYFLKRMPKRVL